MVTIQRNYFRLNPFKNRLTLFDMHCNVPSFSYHHRIMASFVFFSAVIMHLGATLASGHYIAYVRASIDLTNDSSQCPRATQISNVGSDRQKSGSGGSNGGNGNSSSGNGKKGIMKYFSRSSDSKNGASTNSSSSSLHSLVSNGKGNDVTDSNGTTSGTCRSAHCCGMQRILSVLNHRGDANPHRFRHRSQESFESNSNGLESDSLHFASSTSSSATTGNNGDIDTDLWLECDDENISVITRRTFEDELNSKQSSTTPYLLFYERV